MVKKKGKKKKKPEQSDECPRCKGKGETTFLEEMRTGGTRKIVEICDLCHGSRKKR